MVTAFLEEDMRKIYYETEYGVITLKLKSILQERKISIYKLSKQTGVKYDILKDYCNNLNTFYSFETLAKICYSLDCGIEDLLEYEKNIPINRY